MEFIEEHSGGKLCLKKEEKSNRLVFERAPRDIVFENILINSLISNLKNELAMSSN